LPDATLSLLQGLHRLLEARGVPVDPFALREALGADPAPDDIAAHLRGHGYHARWARIDEVDLPHLDLPALVRDADGGTLLVVERTRKGYWLTDAEGRRSLAAPGALLGGVALDMLPGLPPGNLWTRILKLLWAHRRVLYGMAGVAVLAQLLALATPQFTQVLVDRAFPDGARSIFTILILAFLAVGAFQIWIALLDQKFSLYFQNRLDPLLQRGLLSHVLRLPYPVLQSWTVGEIMLGFSGFATAKDLLTGNVLSSLLGGVTGLAYLALMARLSPGATLFIVGMTFLSVCGQLVQGYYLAKLQRAQVKAQARESSFLVEMMGGVPTLKAFGAEQEALGRWMGLLKRKSFLGLHNQRVGLFSSQAFGLLGQAQTLVITVWLGSMALSGELKLGEMLAFTMYGAGFQGAISGFAGSLVSIWMSKPLLETAHELLKHEPEPLPALGPRKLAGPLVLRDVAFRYGPQAPWVLENVNLEVQPGQIHQIEGPSGSGKTTLLRLLAGFYPPGRGTLSIGGLTPLEARALVIYLPQFVQLFNGSILDNLRLYSGHASRERLMEASRITGLGDVVEALPMGYDTHLSQKGGNFSGGQRQLVALTGVLASDRPVVLLDEAMANLDPLWKARLSHSELFKGRTILYAAHDGCLAAAE